MDSFTDFNEIMISAYQQNVSEFKVKMDKLKEWVLSFFTVVNKEE
jgi:hypothetical protein